MKQCAPPFSRPKQMLRLGWLRNERHSMNNPQSVELTGTPFELGEKIFHQFMRPAFAQCRSKMPLDALTDMHGGLITNVVTEMTVDVPPASVAALLRMLADSIEKLPGANPTVN